MIAVWFSCGAASAVAAKLTLQRYGEQEQVRVVNNPIVEEDEDNRRFLADVQGWLGVEIETSVNPEWPTCSAEDVWRTENYMGGPGGAPCTDRLKKGARLHWEKQHKPDWHVLGFTSEERKRFDNFVLSERSNVLPVLIDAGMTKQKCADYLRAEGIRLPRIYEMGYPNANCIGCVKASSPTYWNHVRKVHPEVFARRAAVGLEINERYGGKAGAAKIVRHKGKRIRLDELPADAVGRPMKNLDFECGIFCEERR